MREGHCCRRKYRAWAAQQLDLPLYWQPKWLDVVDPYWTAASDNWTDPSWVWPYVLNRRLVLTWISLPRVTAYLGPRLLRPSASLPALPTSEINYGIFTLHEAAEVCKYPGQVRAMGCQVLDLKLRPNFSTLRRRQIRSSANRNDVELFRSVSVVDLKDTFEVSSSIIPAHAKEVMAAACYSGFGEFYIARTDDGVLLATLGIVFDARTAYLVYSARTKKAGKDTGSALQAYAIDQVRERGLSEFNFQSGHLPGPARFFQSFGAKPKWYGQVRAATSYPWRMLESIRGFTNPNRL